MSCEAIPELQLNDGNTMPAIGLGTWPMNDAGVAHVIPLAVASGFRLIDTAVNYRNESGVGIGVRSCGIARDELFITTKVPGRDHGFASTKHSLPRSLERMGLEYVDLYLIHWPNPLENKFVETWQAFVELQQEGLTRSIGVSNFKPAHIKRVIDETGVHPAVNQVQLHPGITQVSLRKYHETHGIVTEAWSPLGLGATGAYYNGDMRFLETPMLSRIAETHGVSSAQVVLRWHVQQGIVPIPKSSSPKRLQENINVFSFTLSEDEMRVINALNGGRAEVADSDKHQEF